ncbi:hypothetical protein NEUTE1DRAFT_83456 [Neurospora tetrasperma FGSC 2508]|uniref:ER-bound oxygenase mpaB/mpaB'/Rubber oxygenase catalytic domain-containing protein n=1 Tax=Neurospora tetrasperma (strain FGSC 2508 / ATCC MYA-4615 / P0657) TaxID=510951 RepID=F8MPL1_NEUT8|nr:uncharacterized protein NEUTE1DRAFT_83456 [Neurospora tetrasperma FGSC 2508]EGO56323.1 hypothetical protein NEUTE1DRAFT_83456 [Neurospora tetrasperma FGSC 2508]
MCSNNNNPNRKNIWGYTFDWTPSHLTSTDLHPLTLSYDKLTNDCLDEFDALGLTSSSSSSSSDPSPSPSQNSHQCPLHHHNHHHHQPNDFLHLLQTYHPSSPSLSTLWKHLTTIPAWVSYPSIARGQAVFYRYAGPAITSLTFHSLLGGMASARVVETLARTGGFGTRVARRRLLETFQHILDVTEGVGDGGRGWRSTVRVRFLHGMVRRRIMTLAVRNDRDNGYWDTQKWGIPINDLDSIATIASFSSALIWMGLPRQGIFLTSQEINDYLALWRYVAYLIGVPDTITLPSSSGGQQKITPFGSAQEAKVVMESIMLSELSHPSETSAVLANNIIASLANQPPLRSSESFLRAQAYWLNGSSLCKALHIPKPGVWYAMLVISQCLFFMVFCYSRQAHYLLLKWVPSWGGGPQNEGTEVATGEERYKRVRRWMRKVVVEMAGGKEADFGFEWVPEWGKYTGSERGKEEGGGGKGKGKGRGKKGWRDWIASRNDGSEFRSLKAFLVASTVLGCLVCVGVRGLFLGMVPLFR